MMTTSRRIESRAVVQASSLSERPFDGDHTLGFGGNGVEGADGQVKRVAVVTCGANVPDGGGNGSSRVCVLDVDHLAAEVGTLREVLSPVTVGVDGDSVLGVRVVLTTSTGVTVLVEVGSETTSLDVTGRRSTGRSLGGSLGLSGPSRSGLGGPSGRSLGGRLGGDGLGVGRLGLVVDGSGLVDRSLSSRGGSDGRRLGRVRSAVGETSLFKSLFGEHRRAAVGEELASLLTRASDLDVSSVV